jgi:hypothetical protein
MYVPRYRENLGILYEHLVYLTSIGNILWPFGIFCGHLVNISPFWYFGPRKIWQPCHAESAKFNKTLFSPSRGENKDGLDAGEKDQTPNSCQLEKNYFFSS